MEMELGRLTLAGDMETARLCGDSDATEEMRGTTLEARPLPRPLTGPCTCACIAATFLISCTLNLWARSSNLQQDERKMKCQSLLFAVYCS